jgi:hypothetical protein
MPKFQPKTKAQIKAMFGLGRPLGCGKPDLEALAIDVSGGRVERLSQLSFSEANAIISRLGGNPFSGNGAPRRTTNYQRQQAGVSQIAQPAQLQLLRDLAAGRNWSDETLEKFCLRVIKYPRPRTTDETNKIIEALKAMNKRDRQTAKEAA